MNNVRDAKDDNTGDDVEEVKDGEDSHQLMEVVPLCSEPDDEAGVANHTQNTKQGLVGNKKLFKIIDN